MFDVRKPELNFANGHANAIEVPVRATHYHQPHPKDIFIIELNEDEDTVNFFLNETDGASGADCTTRKSITVPLGMLADLVRRRPITSLEKEASARVMREFLEEFGDGEDDEGESEGQRV